MRYPPKLRLHGKTIYKVFEKLNDFTERQLQEELNKTYRKIDKLELDFLNGYLEKRG